VLSFPRQVGSADEGLILYEAKRLLAGDVYFRDVFEIIPPGSQYLVAAAFRLFGATVVTARALDAAVHALIAALIYACSRAAGVRGSLAVVAAAMDPVVFWPVWPYVSPHWMSTALILALLWAAISRPLASHRLGAATAGALLGLMVLVQHQRAFVFAAAAAVLIVGDWAIARRYGARDGWRAPATQLGLCAGAAMLVALPPFGMWVAMAGAARVIRALVLNPLFNYRTTMRASWGQTWPGMTARYAAATVPVFLRWSPAALGVVALVGGRWWWLRARPEAVRTGWALAVLGAAAICSSLYFPDLIHLGFIAPLGAVAVVLLCEWAVRPLGRATATRPALAIAAAVVVALLGWRGSVVHAQAWGRIRASAPTAFGTVDFDDAGQVRLIEAVNRLAAADPRRRLFCYPGYPALYLLTDTWNPTPFQIVFPGLNTDEQVAVARDLIASRTLPVVLLFPEMVSADDPVSKLIMARYVRVPGQRYLWRASDSQDGVSS
jgi:hypothetical protein